MGTSILSPLRWSGVALGSGLQGGGARGKPDPFRFAVDKPKLLRISLDLRTGAGVSMTVTPAHSDRAVVPGTDEIVRGTTYTLVPVVSTAPATVEYSVTPR